MYIYVCADLCLEIILSVVQLTNINVNHGLGVKVD